jgi:hypothetical protein
MNTRSHYLLPFILLAGLSQPALASFSDCSPPPPDCSPKRLAELGNDIRTAWNNDDSTAGSSMMREIIACQIHQQRSQQNPSAAR